MNFSWQNSHHFNHMIFPRQNFLALNLCKTSIQPIPIKQNRKEVKKWSPIENRLVGVFFFHYSILPWFSSVVRFRQEWAVGFGQGFVFSWSPVGRFRRNFQDVEGCGIASQVRFEINKFRVVMSCWFQIWRNWVLFSRCNKFEFFCFTYMFLAFNLGNFVKFNFFTSMYEFFGFTD